MIYLVLSFGLLLGSLPLVEHAKPHMYDFDYNYYQVLRLQPATYRQNMWVKLLQNNTHLDFWSPTDVLVKPYQLKDFKEIIGDAGIEWSTLITNVKEVIDEESIHQQLENNIITKGLTFEKYLRYDEILLYLKLLNGRYSKVTTLNSIGNSVKERTIPILKISGTGDEPRNVIAIMAGLKGRDWFSVAMALYIIQQLVENPAQSYLLRKVDWHIIPVLNPDGYEYTHITDRMSFKNRQDIYCDGKYLTGTDLNRNFGFKWNGYGEFSEGCSPVYAGPTPFSEPESRALRAYVQSEVKRIKLFLSLYSQGHYIVYPWSYTSHGSWNKKKLESLARRANDAQESQTGQRCRVGSASKVLYRSSGTFEDWLKGRVKIPYCFRVGLPGGGAYGYDVPHEYINRTLKGFFPAIRTFGGFVANPHSRGIRRSGSDRTLTMSLDVGICCAVLIIFRTYF